MSNGGMRADIRYKSFIRNELEIVVPTLVSFPSTQASDICDYEWTAEVRYSGFIANYFECIESALIVGSRQCRVVVNTDELDWLRDYRFEVMRLLKMQGCCTAMKLA